MTKMLIINEIRSYVCKKKFEASLGCSRSQINLFLFLLFLTELRKSVVAGVRAVRAASYRHLRCHSTATLLSGLLALTDRDGGAMPP